MRQLAEDFWAEPSLPPFAFTLSTYLNNIRYWTMPVSADSMGIDDGYVGTNPVLGPLTGHGAAPGYFEMPTYLVGVGSPLFDAYSPWEGHWETYPWSTDQRGFNRPQINVTLGSTEQ